MRSSPVVPSRLATSSAAAFLDDRSARMFALSDNTKEGGGRTRRRERGGRFTRGTPTVPASHSEIARQHSANAWSQLRWPYATVGLALKWDAFRLWPALLSQNYVQHLPRCTPGRTECIGRDGRYIRDTCGIFVPCHYRPCLAWTYESDESPAPGKPSRPSPAPAPEPEPEPDSQSAMAIRREHHSPLTHTARQ